MANRYTRITPSKFNPLTAGEIFQVPLSKQRQHDEALAKYDELGLFDINRLSEDDEAARAYIDKYKSGVNTEIDSIMKSGVTNRSKRNIRKMMQERTDWLSSDKEGGQMVANYDAYTKNKKDLENLYQTGKISRDKYLLGLQQSRSQYKGVAEGDTYSPFNAVLDVDIEKKANEIAKAIGDNPVKITEFSGLQFDPRVNKYLDVKTNRTYTPQEAIQIGVEAGLKMNQGVMSDLNQRMSLGMYGDTSVDEYMKGLGSLGQIMHGKNNFETSKQYTGIADVNNGSDKIESPSYEYGTAEELKLRNNNFSNRLNKILSGQLIAGASILTKPSMKDIDGGQNPYYQEELAEYKENVKKQNKPYQLGEFTNEYNRLSKGLKETGKLTEVTTFEDRNRIYQELVQSGQLEPEIDINSPEANKAINIYNEQSQVKNWLDTHQDIDYQPVIYTDGITRTYEGRSSKYKKTTSAELAHGIFLNAEKRLWVNPETKRAIPFDELPKKYKDFINEKKGDVSGAFSPKNYLQDQLEVGGTNRNALNAPYEIKFPDGKKFIVGRSQSELNSLSYRVDSEFGDVWRNINKMPGITYETSLSGVGSVKVVKNDDGSVTLREVDKNGNYKTAYNEEEDTYPTEDLLWSTLKILNGISE